MDGIILRPGEGRSIDYAGSPVRIMLDHAGLALVETSIPAGFAGPPPHRHHDFDEGFFVLDGALTFRVDGQEATGAAGTFALAPKGTTHTFANPGTVPARVLGFWTPGWGLDFLEEMGTVLPVQGQPDLRRVAEVYRRHNSVIVHEGD